MNGFSPVRITRFGSRAMAAPFAEGMPESDASSGDCGLRGGSIAAMLRAALSPPTGARAMSIELWTWNTPNGRKITAALEEMGLRYTIKPVHIGKGEQFKPEFLKISPNNRIPAIIDPDGPGGQPLSVF